MPTMLPVVLVLLGLFLTGYAIVALKRGVGQIVGGLALLILSLTAIAVPLHSSRPAPARTFTMEITAR